jgi:ribosome biogenesis GTPase
VLPVSAASGAGLEQLRAQLRPGVTFGFVGSSGVGKSSLINRLLGSQAQTVSGLREDQRGRHTTTRRELLVLPGGGVLLDTPGMRELGLVDDAGGMAATFAEIAGLAARCRFRDCQHQAEPGCAVQAAVGRGELASDRLASYHKLQREIAAAERRSDPVHAANTKRRWKAIHKAMRSLTKTNQKRRR